MKRNKTEFVLKKLENRFKKGPIYLAACGNKLERMRINDPFYSAMDVHLNASQDSDDIYVHDLDCVSLVILTACFMMDMAYEMCLKYNANATTITEYVMGKVCSIVCQMEVPEIIPDIHDVVIDRINERRYLYSLIVNQKVYSN